MKILFNKTVLNELKKSVDDRNSKYGNSKHTEMIPVQGKHGVFYRKQTVGRKKQEVKGHEKSEVEENKKPKSGADEEHSYAHTTGDHVCFMKDGQRLTGVIVGRLGTDGCHIKGTGKAKGAEYEVLHSDIKQVTKMINPNDAIRDLMDKENIKAGWRGTDGMQPESCDTIEGLLETIGKVRDEFNGITDGIKAEFEALNPVVMKRATLKSVVRIKEKLREDAKEKTEKALEAGIKDFKAEEYERVDGGDKDIYHCRTIRDCDGHTICLNSIEEVANVLKYLDKQSYAVRIKNNFAKPTDVGYSDINANIRLSNGAIVEMQINTVANMVAKERYGHALYEVYRSVKSNPKYAKLADAMAEAQKALYGLSNDMSKKGTFPATELPKDKNGNQTIYAEDYKFEPFAAAIRNSVKDATTLFKQAKADGTLDSKTAEHFEHLIDYIK